MSTVMYHHTMELTPIEAKAVRLVEEGRVTILWENDQHTAGHGLVDGDTGTYRCSFSPEGRVCTCPAGAHHRKCAHPLALELATQAVLTGLM